MTTYEDIARQKLSLVVDNPHPRRRDDTLARMVVLVELWAVVAFSVACWWGASMLVRW